MLYRCRVIRVLVQYLYRSVKGSTVRDKRCHKTKPTLRRAATYRRLATSFGVPFCLFHESHFALPSISSMPGRGIVISPSVAMISRERTDVVALPPRTMHGVQQARRVNSPCL